LERIRKEELLLDDQIKFAQKKNSKTNCGRSNFYEVNNVLSINSLQRYAFVSHDDVRNLPSMQGQTLIAIKAPAGTRLEVPDPDEGMSGGKRRYQIFLQSEQGTPIDVYLVSQETAADSDQINREDELQEVQQEIIGVEVIGSPTQSLKRNLTLPVSPESVTLDATGLLKLTSPSHNQVDPDPDYYLNNMYQTEGISDFYTEDIL